METIRELLLSIRNTAFERISSPVTGSFVLSWFFCNWQAALLLLFGDDKFETRLNTAAQYIGVWSGFIFPAACAAVICLALPRVNLMVFESQRLPNSKSMRLNFKKHQQSLLWSIKLKKLSAQDAIAYESELKALKLDNARIQAQIDQAEKERGKDKDLINELQERLSLADRQLAEANHQLAVAQPDIERAKQSQSHAWALMQNMVQEIEAGKSAFIEFYNEIENVLDSYYGEKNDFTQTKYRIINRLEDAIAFKDRGG